MFLQKWHLPLSSTCEWRRSLSRLLTSLESDGCHFSACQPGRWRISIPGPDRMLSGNFESSAHEFMRRIFWDQADLVPDESARTVTLRWRYWTYGNLATHAIILVFFATELLMARNKGPSPGMLLAAFALANSLPFALWMPQARRLETVFEKAGFRDPSCSVADETAVPG